VTYFKFILRNSTKDRDAVVSKPNVSTWSTTFETRPGDRSSWHALRGFPIFSGRMLLW